VDGEIAGFALPATGSFPSMIVDGPDGALWFTLNQANAIGRITTGGQIATYPLPTRAAVPVGIARGENALWFAEILAGQLGRITVDGVGRIDASGAIESFPLPDPASEPHGITVDDGGAGWVALETRAIARLTLT